MALLPEDEDDPWDDNIDEGDPGDDDIDEGDPEDDDIDEGNPGNDDIADADCVLVPGVADHCSSSKCHPGPALYLGPETRQS